ncbi:uncharacterized protein EI97DRAFT_441796 [Westerdykella ornata]|uniref:Uncharacterized protein n=1 Tax=Westerdykella ornata TaxID=318751 RepID=A0A6A6JLP5_WESOR|nr:uncharacterized protein EI97DRAFT_441796 [Westerdykella ornata]KAF2277033.1 hypothetical protein EI97DRAFT_441796 [Westerdykella ornata]
MRVETLLLAGLLGTASALNIQQRAPQRDNGHERDSSARLPTFKPKTKKPQFFHLFTDDDYSDPRHQGTCPGGGYNGGSIIGPGPLQTISAPRPTAPIAPIATRGVTKRQALTPPICLNNYVIRLQYGKVYAVPYNRYYRGDVPTFFVDDDTKLYTVSRNPLQFYVARDDASLRYSRIGWTPPNAITVGFHHQGNNPLKTVTSTAFLTWPSTWGTSVNPNWFFCSEGDTGIYQVFANFDNWAGGIGQGIYLDKSKCAEQPLAAVNANPWEDTKKPGKKHDYDSDDERD